MNYYWFILFFIVLSGLTINFSFSSGDTLEKKLKKVGFDQNHLQLWLKGDRPHKKLHQFILDHDLAPSDVREMIINLSN